jgi:hypothetical protein
MKSKNKAGTLIYVLARCVVQLNPVWGFITSYHSDESTTKPMLVGKAIERANPFERADSKAPGFAYERETERARAGAASDRAFPDSVLIAEAMAKKESSRSVSLKYTSFYLILAFEKT